MRAEIIAVGTELLLGDIVNTNAQYLAKRLAEEGIGVYFQTVVGDNWNRLKAVIEIARSRADLLIFTGGLGPTQDDLTKEVVAEAVGARLVLDPAAEGRIRAYFAQRDLPMTGNNLKQALVLEHADVFPNEHGLAPGMAYRGEAHTYILLPGPPSEMKPMFERQVIPYLRRLLPQKKALYSRYLRFFGIGESALVSELGDLIDMQQDPTIAPYAKEGEVSVRITTQAASAEEAEKKMAPLLDEIYRRTGQYIYGEGEEISLESVVLGELGAKGRTLACAESCTGGLLSMMLTSLPGSSAVFKGGVVSYTNFAKERYLQVDPGVLAAQGAVSLEAARQMAEGVRKGLQSDFGLSITGNAGPQPMEGKPVGLVYIGLSSADGAEAEEFRFAGTREGIRLRAAKAALFMLLKKLRRVNQG